MERLFFTAGFPDTAAGRNKMSKRLEALRGKTVEAEKQLLLGWHVGNEEHRVELVRKIEGQLRRSHASLFRRNNVEIQAEAIVQEELKRRKWAAADLVQSKKSDPVKIAVAQRLRRDTTVTIGWISQRLKMGTPSSLAVLLSKAKQ